MDSDEVYDMGLLLKNLRERHNLSQQEAATRLSVARSTIASYEGNISQPSIDMLKSLAVFYRTSTDYILGLKKDDSISLKNFSDQEREAIFKIVDAIADLSQSNSN